MAKFGPYELLHKLGTGAAAEVHLATGPNKAGAMLFALKILVPPLSERTELRDQFLHEARLASSIHHPSVAEVFDVGEAEERAYLAMEYVRGRPLAALLRKLHEPLSVGEACFIVREAVLGLHEAHEAADARRRPLGLVHRDVSPQNVMVREDGRIKVVDFGLARVTSSEEAIAFTVGGPGIKGKIPYMPPEQVRNEPLDRRADVFAACAVLFELLCGRRLYAGETEAELLQQALSLPLPDPLQLQPQLPRELAAVLMMGLERDPQLRTADAAALAEALQPFVADDAKGKLAWRMERSFDPMPRTVDEARMAALAERTSGQSLGAVRPITRGRPSGQRPLLPEQERTTLAAAFPSVTNLRTDPASTDPFATGPHAQLLPLVGATAEGAMLPPTVAESPLAERRASMPDLPFIQAEVTSPVSDAARLHAVTEDATNVVSVTDPASNPEQQAVDPSPTTVNPVTDPSPTTVNPVDPSPTHVHPVEPDEPDEPDEEPEAEREPEREPEPEPDLYDDADAGMYSSSGESPSFIPTTLPKHTRRRRATFPDLSRSKLVQRSRQLLRRLPFPELSTQQTVIALAAVAALGGLGVGVLLKRLTADDDPPPRRVAGSGPAVPGGRPGELADRPRPAARAAEGARGQVVILAEPMAVVTEGGRELGTTPYVGEHSAGVHQFLLRAADGVGTAQVEVTVHANEQVTRRVTLR